MTNKKIDPKNDRVSIPITFLPGFRTTIAVENGVEKNLLFHTWGGLGDQVCAEPTLRYALKHFKDCEISLASERPELFTHLSFKRVFDLREEQPNYEKYFVFETITPPNDTNLVWQFMSHMLVNCVDFPSLCALRCQLPVADREVYLDGSEADIVIPKNAVVVHAGRHWPSKTFPADWWNEVLEQLIGNGKMPILIGADTDDNRGTVEVETDGCMDLRNSLSVKESIWLLQNTRCLLTNDSSPLHLAVSGEAHIGYVATCKHPDMITHWRNGQWGYRMKNFGKGGIWELADYCPNKLEEITAEHVSESQLRQWLPEPSEMAQWASKIVEDGTGH